MDKNKPKSSIWSKLWGTPSGMKKAQGSTAKPKPYKDQSLAEKINWGGQFPNAEQKPKSKGY